DPSTGEYVYTPPTGYVGEDSFEYTICDDGNPQACDTATVYIEVLPEGGPGNEAPIANADTATTEEGTPVDGNVLINDFDPDGDPITVTTTTVTTAEGVVVDIDPNTGEYTYTPMDGFTGEDSFEYTICDNADPALCDTAIVVITVLPDPDGDNNITAANDDAYNTTPGTDLSGNVLDNDSDPEGDTQSVNTTPVDDVDNGTLVLNDDGTFTYTPDDGFTGTDSFVYSVCDDGSPQACDQATVYITVGGTGNTTNAENDINNTFVDTAVSGNVLTNDTDPEGDTQTVTTTTVTTAQGVTVDIDPSTGEYVYTPPMGYVGEDSFEYTVCDDGNPQACDTATVYIEVLPIGGPDNEAPIANADTATTEEGTPVDGNVLVNDFDPDGDPITVTTTTVTTAEGVLVDIDPNTGEYTYTPMDGFTGEDSFEYTICDNADPALCDTAIVVITVTQDIRINITVANDDAYYNNNCDTISGDVSINDSDPEGDTQSVNTTPVDDVDNGTLVLNDDGTFTYTPDDGFTGTDSFIYSVCDDGTPQACDQATVYILITDNTPPDIMSCDVNDTTIECDGENNELLATEWDAQNIAAFEACAFDFCDMDLSGQVTSDYDFDNFMISCGSSGSLEVTYTITDDSGNSVSAMVTLTIVDTTPPNVDSCEIEDMTISCTSANAEEIADQWHLDNIAALQQCASDGCTTNANLSITSDYDFDNITDGTTSVEYFISDECGNISTIVAQLSLENTAVSTNNVSLCVSNSIESQVFNLFDLLSGPYEGTGTWTVTSTLGEVQNGNFFDPLSIELFGTDASETISFNYSEEGSGCPIDLDATIEIHNRCAVLPCGEEDVSISTFLTPNGDIHNEYFEVNGVELCGYTIDVKIVNRWGAIVYESRDYQNNWNGFVHGSSLGSADQVPSGTYYYVVVLENSGIRPLTGPLYIGTE
ncbi:MAG: tandem-95 repeat protein, partial [Flavobacteriaceae bacterium]|nr:tandem-95 repeat protein [Flavobacteriaceae bacterium]